LRHDVLTTSGQGNKSKFNSRIIDVVVPDGVGAGPVTLHIYFILFTFTHKKNIM